MKIPKSENKEFELVPEGNHIAVCIGLIDLGTQETNGIYGLKHQRKIMIQWELIEERMERTDDSGNRLRFVISNRYTLSGYKQSLLMKDLNGWRGQPFTEEDFETFDLKKLIGLPCMLNVIHQPVGEKVYANVTSVARMPKGIKAGETENPTISFEFEDPDVDAFNGLPEWIQNVIRKSPEFRALEMAEIREETKAEAAAIPVEIKVAEVPMSGDDIPF